MKREVTNQEILTGCNSADSPIMSQAWIAAGGHIRPTLARFVGLRLEDPWLGFSHGRTMGITAMFDVSGGYSGGTMDWTWGVPALFLNVPGTGGTNGPSTRATLPRCPHPNLNVEPDLNIYGPWVAYQLLGEIDDSLQEKSICPVSRNGLKCGLP